LKSIVFFPFGNPRYGNIFYVSLHKNMSRTFGIFKKFVFDFQLSEVDSERAEHYSRLKEKIHA